jgi:hypothetical protein
VALAQDASAWGTALGLALSVLTARDGDPSENQTFGWMAAAGNGFLLGAIPLARAWRPSVGRVRLITISGIAGSLVGLGIDLIGDVDDEKTAVAIPTLGATVGLVAGTVLTARREVGPPRRRCRRTVGRSSSSVAAAGSACRSRNPASCPA